MLERVMIIAGESSGELYGALLAKALRSRNPGVAIVGIGGTRMESAGVALISRIASAFGLVEALRSVRRLRASFRAVTSALKSFSPQVVVLIDYPDFNMRVAREARKEGARVLYYVSPQVWAWRSGRVKTLGRLVDMMAVILPFEEEIYRREHIPCEFVGHPVMDEITDILEASGFDADDVGTQPLRSAMRSDLGLEPGRLVMTLMPGSRSHEIERHLPVFREVASSLLRKYPHYQIVVPVAPNLGKSLPGELSGLKGCILLDGKSVKALLASDVALVASGTSTLQCALLKVPMVVVYKLSPLSYLIGRLLVKVEHFSLVNVLLDRSARSTARLRVRELLQREVTSEAVISEIVRLIEDQRYRADIITHLDMVRELFLHKSASLQVADMVEAQMGMI
ncbi:MAG TPA: lipid-A-disaccharide synthase [Dissulfurispiraceae bacterium]|nr:lipid-A-disaccharide synthase [Dissulfurispiraceae bacterium]